MNGCRILSDTFPNLIFIYGNIIVLRQRVSMVNYTEPVSWRQFSDTELVPGY